MAIYDCLKKSRFEYGKSFDQLKKVGNVVRFKCSTKREMQNVQVAVARYRHSQTLTTESLIKGKSKTLLVTKIS